MERPYTFSLQTGWPCTWSIVSRHRPLVLGEIGRSPARQPRAIMVSEAVSTWNSRRELPSGVRQGESPRQALELFCSLQTPRPKRSSSLLGGPLLANRMGHWRLELSAECRLGDIPP
jgi:hypothetical protein